MYVDLLFLCMLIFCVKKKEYQNKGFFVKCEIGSKGFFV